MFFLSFRQALICNPQKELRREVSRLVDRFVLACGAASCGVASRGASRKGPRGTGRDRVWLYVSRSWVLSLSAQIGIFKSTFSPSFSLSFFTKSVLSNLEKLAFLSSSIICAFFGPRCLPNMAANLVLPLVHMYVVKSLFKN